MASSPRTRVRRTCSSITATSSVTATRASPRVPASSSSRAKGRRAPRRRTSSPSPPSRPIRGRGRSGGHGLSPEQGARMKEKEEKLEVEGEVIEALRSRMFRVRLDNGHEALGYMGGRMKRYRIRVFPGDRVRIELSSYDLTRGRIVYRLS